MSEVSKPQNSLVWHHVLLTTSRAYLDGVQVPLSVAHTFLAAALRREPCPLGGEWVAR